ncbi:DUF4129 domain-containing protein [Candidatus Sumerlaeota bacterium]
MAEQRQLALYYNPFSLALYFWTFCLTGLLAHLSLVGRIPYDPQIVAPGVWLTCAALFLLAASMRVPLMDACAGLNYREQFGILVIVATFGVAPRALFEEATIVHCLLGLQLPLVVLMASERAFTRVYLVDLLLLVCYCLDHGEEPATCRNVVLAAGFLLTMCLVTDFFCFRSERFGSVKSENFLRAHLLGLKYYLVVAGLGLALWWLTPTFGGEPVTAGVFEIDYGAPSRGARRALSSREIKTILWHTSWLLLGFVVILAALGYLQRRLRARGAVPPPGIISQVKQMLEVLRDPGRRSSGAAETASAREMIVRAYCRLCELAAARGLEREPSQTPQEFGAALAGKFPEHKQEIPELTRLFEEVKYGQFEPSLPQAREYQRLARAFFRRVE